MAAHGQASIIASEKPYILYYCLDYVTVPHKLVNLTPADVQVLVNVRHSI